MEHKKKRVTNGLFLNLHLRNRAYNSSIERERGAHNEKPYHSGETGEDERTTIIACRNDFQLHSPDMMGEGNSDYTASLSLSHATLITDDAINADGYEYTSDVNGVTYTIQATEDYAEKYGGAVDAYIDYVTGAAILVKSTSAGITLNDVDIRSSTGVALLTALNSDSMPSTTRKRPRPSRRSTRTPASPSRNTGPSARWRTW